MKAVGSRQDPLPTPRILPKVRHHIFVDFLLQIHAHRPIRTDNLVRTNPGIRRNVAARIRNPHIRRLVTNHMMGPFDRRAHQVMEKLLSRRRILAGQHRRIADRRHEQYTEASPVMREWS
jgi:hypothetical protein